MQRGQPTLPHPAHGGLGFPEASSVRPPTLATTRTSPDFDLRGGWDCLLGWIEASPVSGPHSQGHSTDQSAGWEGVALQLSHQPPTSYLHPPTPVYTSTPVYIPDILPIYTPPTHLLCTPTPGQQVSPRSDLTRHPEAEDGTRTGGIGVTWAEERQDSTSGSLGRTWGAGRP